MIKGKRKRGNKGERERKPIRGKIKTNPYKTPMVGFIQNKHDNMRDL